MNPIKKYKRSPIENGIHPKTVLKIFEIKGYIPLE
jgi:hypothetical protein